MKVLRLPSFWRGMGWTAKAGYLLSSHQARDYPEACSILREMRGPKKPALVTPLATVARQADKQPEPLWYQKD